MGKVYFGIPTELALKLRDAFGLDILVETGTYKGNTAVWAAEYFRRVYTIEAWEEYYRSTSQAHKSRKNIKFIHGDSRQQLPEVLSELTRPALIWLDAHWWGNSEISAGTPGECPLMDELDVIGKNGARHFILIDDLHCFQGELNKGSDPRLWPPVDKIREKILSYFPDYYFTTHEDVLIAVPGEAQKIIEDYMRYPGIRVVVPTSNKYLRVLPGFAHYLNKFWSPHIPVTVLRYEQRPPVMPPNFSNVAIGHQSAFTWCSGLRAYLDLPQAPRLFVLMLEDYYLSDQVDAAKITVLWRLICEHDDIAKIDLSGDRMKTPYRDYGVVDGVELVQSTEDASFRGSIQAAIWRKSYLQKHLNLSWDAWQFEKHGCRDDAAILGTVEPVLSYVNAVGGAGNKPGEYDHKKIPTWMWKEMQEKGLV